MRSRKRRPFAAASLVLLACTPALCAAQEFSAEAVYTAVPNKSPATAAVAATSSAKLYVSKDKMRIDFSGLSARGMIVDDLEHTTVVIFQDRKSYQQLGSRPAEYFRVADPENACPAWQQAVGTPIRCIKSGYELVAGRRAVKYTRPNRSGSADEIWVDSKLKYVVKWRIDALEVELRNIHEGPQPADLFVVPPDYRPAESNKGLLRLRSRP